MPSKKLTKTESKNLKKQLPYGTAKEIAESIGVTQRMVQYVLDGEQGDRHGIIELALKHAEANKVRMSVLKKSLAKV